MSTQTADRPTTPDAPSSGVAPPPPTFAGVVRAEWIKLRTVRMNAVLAIIAIAFPLVITVLTAVLIDSDEMNARDLIGLVTGTSVITGMLLGVIGASWASSAARKGST